MLDRNGQEIKWRVAGLFLPEAAELVVLMCPEWTFGDPVKAPCLRKEFLNKRYSGRESLKLGEKAIRTQTAPSSPNGFYEEFRSF